MVELKTDNRANEQGNKTLAKSAETLHNASVSAMCEEINYRSLFCGLEVECPTSNGKKPYVFLDNGASTPSLKCVQDTLNAYIPYYSSVHRGTGFKSLVSTHLYEETRKTILDFVGADPKEHVCIFTRNTTESINRLAKRFPFTKERNIVLTTSMEHHADDLPWRANAPRTVHINVLPDGRLDLEDLKANLNQYKDAVALVAVTGASNVTGFLNPIHEIAKMTHEAGAKIFVDCAQLIAHRAVQMKPLADPEHLDYIAFSAHKMYAPFGTGALIGPWETFNQGEPDLQGGGAVALVTLDTVLWAPAPDRDEAGSPNVPGAVALLAAIKTLQKVGMDKVAQHEADLTAYALEKLSRVPGIRLFGDTDPQKAHSRVGVIPFTIEGICHAKVAAILGYEYGIGVRSGCFCAHPLIGKLLGISDYLVNEYADKVQSGQVPEKPGLIRASFGLYNTAADVDALYDALMAIVNNQYKLDYKEHDGEYCPVGFDRSVFNEAVNVDDIVGGYLKEEKSRFSPKLWRKITQFFA